MILCFRWLCSYKPGHRMPGVEHQFVDRKCKLCGERNLYNESLRDVMKKHREWYDPNGRNF
jgi:hypothetical protein